MRCEAIFPEWVTAKSLQTHFYVPKVELSCLAAKPLDLAFESILQRHLLVLINRIRPINAFWLWLLQGASLLVMEELLCLRNCIFMCIHIFGPGHFHDEVVEFLAMESVDCILSMLVLVECDVCIA